jgi:hypothetical protein
MDPKGTKKGGPMPYYNPEPRFKKPARRALRRPVINSDPRKEGTSSQKWQSHPKPATTTSRSNIPRTETRTPRDLLPKIPISKVLKNNLLTQLLSPSELAGDAETFYDWSKHGENVSKQIAQDNFVGRDLAVRLQPLENYDTVLPTEPAVNANFIRPAVPTVPWFERPEFGPYISTSPKINTIEIVVPDYDVAPPIPVELPERHAWFDEVPAQEIPELVKNFDIPKVPEIDINPEVIRAKKPDSIHEVGVSIEFVAVPEKLPMVKIRPMIIRGSTPRKNDTKAASRWIKLSQLAISLTFGTYTEILDFVEILVWDAYAIDPRTGKLVYAMFEEDYKMINVISGIAEGKYSVDIAATLVDYGVSQATDVLIGKSSKAVTRQVIDTGNWRSPQGPQGFINKMQKDYKNVLSQYETATTNEQNRLLSLQPLSESPRRLWNAKTGLTSGLRS